MKDFVVPTLLAVGIHILLFFLIAGQWSLDSKPERQIAPKHVKAKVVTIAKVETKKVKPVPVEKTKPKPEVKPAPKPEVKPEPKPEVKPKPVAPPETKKIPAKPVEPKVDPKKIVEEKKKEEMRKRLDALQLVEEQRLLERLAQVKADKLAVQQAADDAEQAEEDRSTVENYNAQMKSRIESLWAPPPSARNGMKVMLEIQLTQSGDVISVDILTSSNNTSFDRSAVQAVKKAGYFDVPKDVRVFNKYFRKFKFKFEPTELKR